MTYSSSLGRNVLIVVAPLHFCRDVYAGAREMPPYYSTMHLQRGDIDMEQVAQYSSTGTERGVLHRIYCQDQPGTPSCWRNCGQYRTGQQPKHSTTTTSYEYLAVLKDSRNEKGRHGAWIKIIIMIVPRLMLHSCSKRAVHVALGWAHGCIADPCTRKIVRLPIDICMTVWAVPFVLPSRTTHYGTSSDDAYTIGHVQGLDEVLQTIRCMIRV